MHIGHGSQVVATIAPSRKMSPIVAAGLADGVHLGVGRDVGRQHDRVVRARQHLVAAGDRAAERALAGRDALAALFDRQLHQFGWVHGVSSDRWTSNRRLRASYKRSGASAAGTTT